MDFTRKSASDDPDILEKYTRDLTKEAREGKIDPVIGRDEEIMRVIRILSRRTKNNPVLIGEPGVGKTAIVEGIAQRIVRGDIPSNLKNKKILELDVGMVMAGASLLGEYEDRLKGILNAVEKDDGNIIMFIDELHLIVGAGKTGNGGGMDISQLLKPSLARGKLKTIGATTLKEYREYIEKDDALARRFQQVLVSEPTVDETISILRGLKDRFETYHGVTIHDNALVSAAELSNRYITDRFLPDKAIDLVDEACATIKTELASVPTELEKLNRKVMQLEIEHSALLKETDEKSKKRLKENETELAVIKKEQKELNERWSKEKTELAKITKFRETIESLKNELEVCQTEGKFERAGEIQYSLLPALEKSLADAESKSIGKLTSESVTNVEIAQIVGRWTGINVEGLMETEKEKLLSIETRLKKQVKGQNRAVKQVVDSIIRSRSGIKDPNKPVGTFLFLGPTGVGKTELARALSKILFNTDKKIIRFDMSEYMDKNSTNKLIGAPPGYIGYEEGGRLTEQVRRQPYSIVLFDEIEKAHPDVLNLLLQLLDEGRLTDSLGKHVNFKNTIIIMTSNIGSEQILESEEEFINDKEVVEILSRYLKPEFINRIDNVIVFNSLNAQISREIVLKELDELSERISNTDYEVVFTENSIESIVKNGFDKQFGARSIKRYIQNEIENTIGWAIANSEIDKKRKYALDWNEADKKFILTSSKALN